MLPRQQKASLLFVLLCESVSENAKNEYSQISERTFPLGKFLNKPLGIVKVGNERDLVVRVVLCGKQVNPFGSSCFFAFREYHSLMWMMALPQCLIQICSLDSCICSSGRSGLDSHCQSNKWDAYTLVKIRITGSKALSDLEMKIRKMSMLNMNWEAAPVAIAAVHFSFRDCGTYVSLTSICNTLCRKDM